MKFRITMKDPDCTYESVRDAAKLMLAEIDGLSDEDRELLADSRREKLQELLSKWFEYGEYLTVEIDTEDESISVVPRK